MGVDPHGCCPSYRDHVLTVGVSGAAMPSRRPEVAAIAAKEAGWSEDHPAYRRLRREGLQPKRIDGAARIERHASHALEVEQSTLLDDVKDAS